MPSLAAVFLRVWCFNGHGIIILRSYYHFVIAILHDQQSVLFEEGFGGFFVQTLMLSAHLKGVFFAWLTLQHLAESSSPWVYEVLRY